MHPSDRYGQVRSRVEGIIIGWHAQYQTDDTIHSRLLQYDAVHNITVWLLDDGSKSRAGRWWPVFVKNINFAQPVVKMREMVAWKKYNEFLPILLRSAALILASMEVSTRRAAPGWPTSFHRVAFRFGESLLNDNLVHHDGMGQTSFINLLDANYFSPEIAATNPNLIDEVFDWPAQSVQAADVADIFVSERGPLIVGSVEPSLVEQATTWLPFIYATGT